MVEEKTRVTNPIRYAVIGPSGDAITGFESGGQAAKWAARNWPNLEESETRGDGKGWTVELAGSTPDDVQVVGAGS